MESAPEISVIIPTHNGGRRISACLEALLSQKTDRKFDIIVADDGSDDDTSEIVRKYDKVRLIHQPNAGPAAARNTGVRNTSADIVLFTDDDCVPEPDWLDNMLKPFRDTKIVGAKGAYLTRQKELTARFVQIEYEEKYDVLSKHRRIDFVDTYSAAFRRREFLLAGGYDENFPVPSAEDQEFSFRLANMGYEMVFVPEARVWHTHVGTLRGYLRKKFGIGYWKVLTLMKNPNKISGDSHTPATLKMQILLMAMLFPCLIFSVISPELFLPLSWCVAAAFLLSMIPLTIRCFIRDLPVGFAAPVFIISRAIGLTSGLLMGIWDRMRHG